MDELNREAAKAAVFPDLINRQKAIETARIMCERCTTGDIIDLRDMICESLAVLPSDDAVDVKRGRWEKTEESPMRPYMCSRCGSLFDLDTLLGIPTWRWCPKCGARMEVDDDCT